MADKMSKSLYGFESIRNFLSKFDAGAFTVQITPPVNISQILKSS
jgi:cysteinyl-tRNA synthetase